MYTYIPAWQQLAASVVAATASASSIADAAASSFAEGKKKKNRIPSGKSQIHLIHLLYRALLPQL